MSPGPSCSLLSLHFYVGLKVEFVLFIANSAPRRDDMCKSELERLKII